MYLDRMNDAGPLYDPQIGDPTGGIDVRLYYTESQPLINSFGLRVEDVTDTSDGPIATLKPDFPFWQNVDLSYALGTNLYWRAKNSHWSEDDDLGPLNKKGEDSTEYITFGGGALQELPQRFVSPNSFVWIIGLSAVDRYTSCTSYTSLRFRTPISGVRQSCGNCATSIWKTDLYRFEPLFPLADHANPNGHVFMFVYHTLNSTEGFGPEKAREVEFAIPVNGHGNETTRETKTKHSPQGMGCFRCTPSATHNPQLSQKTKSLAVPLC